ncbi:MAG TPA: hypothetical protein VGG95_04780, partial [Edaphobacter sp.]
MAGKHGDTITIESMIQSKKRIAAGSAIETGAERFFGFRSSIAVLTLSFLGLPGFAQQTQTGSSGNQPSPTETGPSSGPQSSAMAGAQQQLYTASGSNGSQVSQDSFKGSIVEGKSTGNLMDLSLDEAIQRGLRNNLGIILQSASQKNASGQRLEEL